MTEQEYLINQKDGKSAVNKNYVTNQLNMKLVKIINADIDMKNHKIINLANPVSNNVLLIRNLLMIKILFLRQT